MKTNAVLNRWSDVLVRKTTSPAVLSPRGDVLRTFADLEAEARSLPAFEAGSVVAIQIDNSASWPAVLLACFRAGTIPLPLGRHMEQAERAIALETCGATAVLELGGEKIVLTPFVFTPDSDRPPPDCDFLKLTSGTTSTPRAIRFTGEQLVADCDNICDTMGIADTDLNFGVIPFSHSYGFSNLITPLLCRGVPLVASEDRMPRAILDGLASSRATVFPGMPVFYQTFGEMAQVPELAKLRLCISAGAPLLQNVAQRFTEKFGLKIHTFYGASECGGIGYDGSDEMSYEDGFAGAPMENVHIRHRPGDAIEVWSGAVGLGYFPAPELETLGGGRFVPSDLIRRGARGMYLLGRVSDIINVAGRKLNPAEVEAHLLRFKGVRRAVVFGVPSVLRHEEPVACVTTGSTPCNKRDLLHFCRARLSAWQVPKDVWIVDEIPTNDRGKISRRELARRYLHTHR